jgi:hypothetical protein
MQYNGLSKIILSCLLLFIVNVKTSARSIETPEIASIRQLADALNTYERIHQVKAADFDLDKIKEYYDIDRYNKQLIKNDLPPIEEGYLFLKEPVSYVASGHQSNCFIILARKKPLKNEFETGFGEEKISFHRYLIYRNENGKLKFNIIHDQDFIKMLDSSSNVTKEMFGLAPNKASKDGSSAVISLGYKNEYQKDIVIDDLLEPSMIKGFQRSKYFGAYLVSIFAVVLIGLFFGYRKRTHSI